MEAETVAIRGMASLRVVRNIFVDEGRSQRRFLVLPGYPQVLAVPGSMDPGDVVT